MSVYVLKKLQVGDLDDVTLTSPANGQVLSFNGSAWVNADASGGATTLNELTDVTITSAATGEYLKFDGATWVNDVIEQGDVSGLVSALAGKASSSHVHSGADITTGTVANARTTAVTAATASTLVLRNALGDITGRILNANNNIISQGAISAQDTITAGGTGFNGPGVNINTLDGGAITQGTVAPARLGSGTPDDTTYLRGDGSWQTPSGGSGSPTGTVTAFAASMAPTGWLLCDGSAVSRSTYAELYATIGVVYGSGDTSTTFNVPDLRGRLPVGQDGAFYMIGQTGGQDAIGLLEVNLPSHSHTYSGGGHTHGFSFSGGSVVTSVSPSTSSADINSDGSTGSFVTSVGESTGSISGSGTTDSASESGTTSSVGSGAAFSVVQPYVSMNYIIKF